MRTTATNTVHTISSGKSPRTAATTPMDPSECERSALKAGSLQRPRHDELQYSVSQTPPWSMCLVLGFQHYISMFMATLTIPFLMGPVICVGDDHVGLSYIIGTLFVASGLITLIQTALGVRLPIVQAGTYALLAPTLAFFSLPEWKCPENIGFPNDYNATLDNRTYIEVGSDEHREIWMSRLRVVQGSLMVGAAFELILGITGIVGLLLRYIGPLAICPTVTLLGLNFFKSAANYGSQHWWICIFTLVLMVIFSQYLGRLSVPCFAYDRKDKQCKPHRYPVFKMFPVVLSVGVSWLLCFILTMTEVLPSDPEAWGYGARTDIRTHALRDAPWFRVPYPCQWGMPTFSVACMCGLMSGILATMVESVGDYSACANLAGAPPPPPHAINRGIFVEGLGSFLDALFGTGNGTTSTSVNVGVIGITKVGSRSVVQVSAVFMIIFGVLNKFGALFITLPDPVIGGTFIILFGMIVAVGLSNLQHVDMNSGRNLFIVGFSLFTGITIPQWVIDNPTAINTGNATADSVIFVLLSTGMFVGGVLGFTLDNTIPGTPEERGLTKWRRENESEDVNETYQDGPDVYDLPVGMSFIRRYKVLEHLPISPTYKRRSAKDTHPTSSEEQNYLNCVANSDAMTAV